MHLQVVAVVEGVEKREREPDVVVLVDEAVVEEEEEEEVELEVVTRVPQWRTVVKVQSMGSLRSVFRLL